MVTSKAATTVKSDKPRSAPTTTTAGKKVEGSPQSVNKDKKTQNPRGTSTKSATTNQQVDNHEQINVCKTFKSSSITEIPYFRMKMKNQMIK